MIEEIISYFYDIPIIGGILQELIQFNFIIGIILIFIIGIITINGISSSYFNFNFIARIFAFLKNYSNKDRYKNKRKKFYEISATKEFSDWQLKTIKSLYENEVTLSIVSNKKFPIVSYLPKTYMDIISFKERSKLDISSVSNYSINHSSQKYYYKLVGATIKRPELLGYKLDELFITDNMVDGFRAGICTYKENIMTSHYLDYELFKAFQKFDKAFLSMSKEEKLKNLPYLKQILNENNVNEVIKKGFNRASLISVQMIIVFKDDRNNYKTLLIQRSEDVAVKPGYWQIVPSGGFEIFEKTNQKSNWILEENFDIELAVYRELAEEIFDFEEFTHNEKGNAKENILVQKEIKKIRKYIQEGKASLDFIGIVVDLVTFRPELCFLLLIHTSEFSQQEFKSNHEGKDIQILSLERVRKLIETELFNPTSAGLYNLALNHPEIQKILYASNKNKKAYN